MRFLIFSITLLSFALPNITMAKKAKMTELIILAAPRSDDPYYSKVRDQIFNFQINYAKKIIQNGDQVLILTDKKAHGRYKDALGKHRIMPLPISDIWMRDFSTSNVTSPIMFRYTAAGQGGGEEGQRDADAVQEELALIAEKAGMKFKESNLLNDGGNFVDDYHGNIVVSRKFLSDNNLTEKQGREKLRQFPSIKQVAFIEADEQGGLEHADGVVSFIAKNTLIINSYPNDKSYAQKLKADLKRGLPGVKIHEITTPYDGTKIYDEKFGSACGLYTNALVTLNRIYFPQFGIPEDKIALAQIKAITNRKVIPIGTSDVCFMGGGVRCMSWQLRGEPAERLLSLID